MKNTEIKQHIYRYLIVLSVTVASCAQVGSPTGGPRDVTPPSLTVSTPAISSTAFSGDEVIISFNEYIQLRDVYNEMLISPPLAERPVITARNRDVSVLFGEPLLPNTTYTINFGGAITDLNEGNALNNFEFVFSTGSTIDTLALTGTAFSAFDGKPPAEKEKVYILLYENLNDSAPFLELPRYIGKVDTKGSFTVNNIHEGVYMPVVVRDTDGDILYDPVIDDIGFSDSLVTISAQTAVPLTVVTDTTGTAAGGVPKTKILHAANTSLLYFKELPSRVFVDNKSRPSPERLFITFSRPPYDSLSFSPLNFTPSGQWYAAEYSQSADTVTLWLTDNELIDNEDLQVEISYTTVDSTGNFSITKDSASFVSRAAVAPVSRRQAEAADTTGTAAPSETLAGSVLSLSSSTGGGRPIDLDAAIRLKAARPVSSVIDTLFVLEQVRDSLKTARDFTISREDSVSGLLSIHSKWQPAAQYSLTVLPGAVTDIYGTVNDTVKLQFRTRDAEEYGNIKINLQSDSVPLIVQLLNDKGLVVKEVSLMAPGTASFNYMMPGNYNLKAVYDTNGNGKWDTGNYLKKIMPEKVDFYDKPVSVRANWDYDYSWQTGY